MTSPQPNETTPKRRFSTAILLAVIFVPTIATMFVAQTSAENLSLGTAICGGLFSGCVGGVLLARRVGKTIVAKIAWSPFLIFVLSAACISMNCAGCIASSNFKVVRH